MIVVIAGKQLKGSVVITNSEGAEHSVPSLSDSDPAQ